MRSALLNNSADSETAPDALKQSVRRHWELEPCGTRGSDAATRHAYFASIEQHRYTVEPHIPAFADFGSARGMSVLEIGIGAGTDHVNWLRAGARAVGIDLTTNGVLLARERAELEGLRARAFVADAEALPFRHDAFDLIYSFGVVHHTPDTQRAIHELHRTLKPGGVAKVMIYHRPSVVAFLLWLYYCAGGLKPWRSPTWAVFHHLESPGTKAYTLDEARQLFRMFRTVTVKSQLGPGDLLTVKPSMNYSSKWIQLAWRLYPRWIIRRLLGDRFGLELLVEAVK
jgi:ubiquinone/menaquinone biosynthesis C-methylase UbiE